MHSINSNTSKPMLRKRMPNRQHGNNLKCIHKPLGTPKQVDIRSILQLKHNLNLICSLQLRPMVEQRL